MKQEGKAMRGKKWREEAEEGGGGATETRGSSSREKRLVGMCIRLHMGTWSEASGLLTPSVKTRV